MNTMLPLLNTQQLIKVKLKHGGLLQLSYSLFYMFSIEQIFFHYSQDVSYTRYNFRVIICNVNYNDSS